MPIQIQNNKDATVAGVTSEHQLKVQAESHSMQHHISWVNEEVYQAISTDTGITAKTQTLLHIKNTSSTKNLVISFVRMQCVTNTASKPVVGEYFQLGLGEIVASGGTETTPVNMNTLSGKVAEATCTGIDPTMSGTFTEIDKYYDTSNEEHIHNKQGSIILGLNDTFSVRFVSAGTGEAVARATFMMINKGRD